MIISSSATSLALWVVATAFSLNSLAVTTSVGKGIDVFSMRAFALATKPGSYKDLPTPKPAAAKKVLAIPPPTIS